MEKKMVEPIDTNMTVLFENTYCLSKYTHICVCLCVWAHAHTQLSHRYNHSNKYIQNRKGIILSVVMIFG